MSTVIVSPVVQEILDLIGIFAFGLSGALLAVRKRFDAVGIAVLAEVTALGGGVLRDVVIGAVPPVAFTDMGYFVTPLVAAALTYFWHPRLARINRFVLIFDAFGLGVFCVAGTIKALNYGMHPLPAAALGVMTAIGGGALRDVLAGEVPALLHPESEIYAVPALLGSALVAGLAALHLLNPVTSGLAALIAVTVRLLALRFGWRAPLARGVGSGDGEG
ncbi:trimeric intracellular cation channel family protein [Saccharopolyspora erythraea]|uniref:Integral membrane protein n=2 Tax=Saccharopolyspora erythraea TaxID=1836 RepID=A4FAX2_SACEN|nr:trimeric intracellular cation channel family protein [Saccharopolyspora erythraea]EQD87587.1 membrane protein [Saccharopolyspora erythraea D]QRK91669.1 trimeric intracellular cation channel family protein [Saccharopolyspora erythraea]CAM01197.1 putative integral membrane protein [Saccharopolyspora erythraea NRRL 2338]